jgi:nucleoid-associated protein YgaU
MPHPRDYFTDPAEKLIAETAWAVAANPSLDAWTPMGGMSMWTWLPQTHDRIVLARAWTTERRETPDPGTDRKDGGVAAMQVSIATVLNATNVKVTAKNIANVEHFFSSALISTIGGLAAGPALAGASSVFWELSVGPYALVVAHSWKTDWTRQDALSTLKIIGGKVVDGMANNVGQLAGPDQRGIRFASALGLGGSSTVQDVKDILGDYYQATNTKPPPHLPKVKSRKHKVQGGEALSLIAKWFYQGETWRWPVIYMRNRAVIGNNYNVIQKDMDLELPMPWEMTAAELTTAKVKHREWNREGRW